MKLGWSEVMVLLDYTIYCIYELRVFRETQSVRLFEGEKSPVCGRKLGRGNEDIKTPVEQLDVPSVHSCRKIHRALFSVPRL